MLFWKNLKIMSSLYFGICLLMFIPGQSLAQWMHVDVVSFGYTDKGIASVKTNYTAQKGSVAEEGSEQNQYMNKVIGYGSPTTVQSGIVIGAGSQVDFAGLTIYKEPAKPPGKCQDDAPMLLVVEKCPPSDCDDQVLASKLLAVEKIGTGYAKSEGNVFEVFAGAGGSMILVNETAHETVASTRGGEVFYFVDSKGEGIFKAGLASDYVRVVVPPEEAKSLGEPIDVSGGLFADLPEPGSQSFRKNIQYTGRYTGYLEGVVAPPLKTGN